MATSPLGLETLVPVRIPRQRSAPPHIRRAPVRRESYDFEDRQIFGLRVAATTSVDLVAAAGSAIEQRTRLLIGVVNAAKVVKLQHDAFLRESLLECDVLVADGQSVVWAGRALGQELPERVAGIDLFEALLELAHREHRRVFLLGAQQQVLDQLVAVVGERWPGVVVAGQRNGYFDDSESAQVAAQIAASDADMLFLGMTTPKKEIFLGSYADQLGVPVLHGVGGSFDVMAGVTKRAPEAWQRCGMEWAYRLAQEPRRLWRRYLTTNSLFLCTLARELVDPRPAYAQPAALGAHRG